MKSYNKKNPDNQIKPIQKNGRSNYYDPDIISLLASSRGNGKKSDSFSSRTRSKMSEKNRTAQFPWDKKKRAESDNRYVPIIHLLNQIAEVNAKITERQIMKYVREHEVLTSTIKVDGVTMKGVSIYAAEQIVSELI